MNWSGVKSVMVVKLFMPALGTIKTGTLAFNLGRSVSILAWTLLRRGTSKCPPKSSNTCSSRKALSAVVEIM